MGGCRCVAGVCTVPRGSANPPGAQLMTPPPPPCPTRAPRLHCVWAWVWVRPHPRRSPLFPWFQWPQSQMRANSSLFPQCSQIPRRFRSAWGGGGGGGQPGQEAVRPQKALVGAERAQGRVQTLCQVLLQKQAVSPRWLMGTQAPPALPCSLLATASVSEKTSPWPPGENGVSVGDLDAVSRAGSSVPWCLGRQGRQVQPDLSPGDRLFCPRTAPCSQVSRLPEWVLRGDGWGVAGLRTAPPHLPRKQPGHGRLQVPSGWASPQGDLGRGSPRARTARARPGGTENLREG